MPPGIRNPNTIKPDMSDYPCPEMSDREAFKAWNREYNKRFRALNPEYERSRNKIYDNSAKGKAVREAYNNSAERKAKNRAYNNSAEGKAAKEAYNNSAEGKAQKRAYEKSAKGKATKKRKEARRRQAESMIPLTKEERQQLIILEQKRLHLTETTGIEYHLDHIVPLAKGGIHHPINLRIITAEENLSKGDKVTPEAMALIPQIQAIVQERKDWIRDDEDGNLMSLLV
jgi:5-methylcytosine-specific restriction endonuclease McrA